jgi:hypothetical protein
MPDHSALFVAVRRAILDGHGQASGEARSRAYDGDGAPGAVASYVGKVKAEAARISDEDVAAVRAAGLGDDEIFELSVAAAVGQASRQYDAAVAALDAALAETEQEAAS